MDRQPIEWSSGYETIQPNVQLCACLPSRRATAAAGCRWRPRRCDGLIYVSIGICSELLLSLSRHSSNSCVLAVLVSVGACRSIGGGGGVVLVSVRVCAVEAPMTIDQRIQQQQGKMDSRRVPNNRSIGRAPRDRFSHQILLTASIDRPGLVSLNLVGNNRAQWDRKVTRYDGLAIQLALGPMCLGRSHTALNRSA